MENKEISVREIILIVKDYFLEIKSKLIWSILFGLVIGLYLAYDAYTTESQYHEDLTFMMDESKGSKGDLTSQLLGNLFGGSSDNNLGKVVQLFGTKQIIHRTLFDSIEIESKNDYLANHMLDLYGIEKLVEQYKGLIFYNVSWPKILLNNEQFRFTHGDVNNFTRLENQYLRVLYETITGNRFADITPKLNSMLDEKSGIMTVTMYSPYEEITIGVLNNIYSHLSEYFVEKSVEKQMKTYKIVKAKKDSIFIELKNAEYSLANFKDSNRKLVTVKGYLSQIRLERDLMILNTMYAEAAKQMELTDFTLKTMTPVVQIIDLPRLPIVPKKESWSKNLIIGLVLGFSLFILFVIIRKFILDTFSKLEITF